MKNKWIKIGEVGVDSGQLMVCDPCYIDSEWKKEGFDDIRRYRDSKSNKIYKFGKHFYHYETKMKACCGKTPNELIKSKRWVEIVEKEIKGFSYNSVSNKGEKKYKQLNYRMGHPGVAVAFDSGFGDGCYPVYAKIKDFGKLGKRVVEVKIVMIDGRDK